MILPKLKRTASEYALWVALPMAQTSRVESRLKMILDKTRSRFVLTRRALLTALGVSGILLVSLAMLRPAVQAQVKPPMSKAAVNAGFDRLPKWAQDIEVADQARSLPASAAAGLARTLATHPDDYQAHIQLLGYYMGKQAASVAAKAAYQQEVFWLIRTHPEEKVAGTPDAWLLKRDDSSAYEQGKTLWLEQIASHPANIPILDNAVTYFTLSDRQMAENLLGQAEALEPANPHWPDRLGRLYYLQTEKTIGASRRLWAQRALAQYEAAAALSPNKTLQHSTSPELAQAAFDAGEYEKARHYAADLLKRGKNQEGYSWNPDDDQFSAHLILGRLAVHDGDIAQAEEHLQAMGRVSRASLYWCCPNMQLAQDLLEKGDRQPVLAYFDECARFWKTDHGKIAQWKSEVQSGKQPDFGINLNIPL